MATRTGPAGNTRLRIASSCAANNSIDGTETTLDLSGLFIAIGNDPRTHLVHGQLDLTQDGTIAVQGRSSRTSRPGVFAAGDVLDATYRQAVTAAASGTVAALDVEHYLASLPAPAPQLMSADELASATVSA